MTTLTMLWAWVVAFWQHRQWMPLAILLIGYLVRLTSSASTFPVNIPARWRPLVVLALGQLYAVLVAVSGGLSWGAAALHGFEVAVWTMGLFDVVVNAICGGNEPAWLAVLLGIVQQEVPKPNATKPVAIVLPRE